MFGLSVDIQTAGVPNASRKPCSLCQLAELNVETSLDFNYLGAK
jgi:hypothetical protein